MLSKFFEPVEIGEYWFDKGMILFEFDAMREPEKTRFPKIGEFIRSRCEMVEIPTPQMYWKGEYLPDFFISNQLGIYLYGDKYFPQPNVDIFPYNHPKNKISWAGDFSLYRASMECHGYLVHHSLIEKMCRKISVRGTDEISAKYHRSLWLPMYWPETLIQGKSIETKFYYPKAGYAGAPLHDLPTYKKEPQEQKDYDTAEIHTTFVVGKPKHQFSVLFVVDASPIYRITNQDKCVDGSANGQHRFVVESNRPITEADASAFVGSPKILGSMTLKMTLPTIRNVSMGWRPAPNMNEQIWSVLHESK